MELKSITVLKSTTENIATAVNTTIAINGAGKIEEILNGPNESR